MVERLQQQELQWFKRGSKMLSLLDNAGLERLAAHGEMLSYPAGSVVVREGTTAGPFYLIAEGQVRVMADDLAGREVARLGAGSFFGEMALVTQQPRSATVQCTVTTKLMVFERDEVMEILRDYPQVHELLTQVSLERAERNFDLMMAGSDASEGDPPVPEVIRSKPVSSKLPPYKPATPKRRR